ncbi:MAG: DUF885 domain-containing protein [Acidobacteriota bacterium]
MMDRAHLTALALAAVVACAPAAAPHGTAPPPPSPSQSWVQRSNALAQPLLDTFARYQPEIASKFGVTTVDDQVVDLKPGYKERSRADLQKVIDTMQGELAKETDPAVRQDLQIMIDTAHRAIAQTELEEKLMVPYIDLPRTVFFGMRSLLDDQVTPERRTKAIVRLRRYAGDEPGWQPVTALAEAYTREQLKNPALLGPFVGEIQKNLGQDQYFIDGVEKLLAKYHVAGYEPVFAKLKSQLVEYNAFIQKEVLPRARADFRLPPPLYALALQDAGIDVPPGRLIALGHAAFDETQKAMQELAPKVAKARGLSVTDYRDVIRALKKEQVQGDAIMALYKTRIASIERIIRDHHLVTLPQRPMIFRFATAAESAATPAPHMDIPQLLGNTGQKGSFVLPLEIPAAPGQKGDQKFDDFTFDAASWTLTAHEGRPGHELQFDTMVEHGVSTARALFALNSTNAEGWGLYSEWLLYPYMPDDGKLISLQHRLLRSARAFLDPELQAGKVTPERAGQILRDDVVLSPALANEEVERYTFWAPGQAPSYYYGFTQLLSIRQEAEHALGGKLDLEKFHDFILDQGLVPPPLLRKAVEEQFIPAQR